ncbi:MAG: hypothetical protein KDA93_00620 [Planctomycetaceae bacterium]|nr:hypothetical protein [Planctomycetaceae bacterium]
MHVVSRWPYRVVLFVMLFAGMANGCAAVSLFDQHHTHHHHYDQKSSDIAGRLESLERQVAKLNAPEKTGVAYSSHQTTE